MIYATQWRCGAGHLLLACLWDEDAATSEMIDQVGKTALGRKTVCPCGAIGTHRTHEQTPYLDIDDADSLQAGFNAEIAKNRERLDERLAACHLN